ncbi:MAG: DUF5597 domain-containing protein [Pelomonas sp.]|nr:DUF5597 domain-containing protein [Roseateles sp.]
MKYPTPARLAALAALALAPLLALAAPAAAAELPHLRRQGDATQLIVDGQPYLARGGELGNSSAEPGYLEPFWPKLRSLNLNTVVTPVYWNLLEPEEGKFDFASIEGLLEGARANGMHLVLLWFGTWKNSMSCYAPDWVKRDTERFPRARDASGASLEILTPFAPAGRAADMRAFGALMRHLREVDAAHTVILVQVENEIGMIPSARDHSAAAEQAWAAPVPAALMDALVKHRETLAPELRALWDAAGGRRSGNWAEVFGTSPAAEEVFMAWFFARYTDAVAAAGKQALALPMYANAALIRPGYQPGQYPSAGPLPHLIDVWRAGAPTLDFIAPDIYFPNFVHWTDLYARAGNPLFIPEALRSVDAAANALYAFGARNAIGFSPFAIESSDGPGARYLASSFELVRELTPLIAARQGLGGTLGFLQEAPESTQPQQQRLGHWSVDASFERNAPPELADGLAVVIGTENSALAGDHRSGAAPAGGLAIQLGDDELLVAGIGITLTFASIEAGWQTGLLSVEEGRYDENGRWQHLRWLNGDQTHQGRHVRLEPGRFTIQRVKLYRYH